MYDPIMIYGFSVTHLVVPTIVIGVLMPRWFNWIIPSDKIARGEKPVAPMETIDTFNEIVGLGSEESGSRGSGGMVKRNGVVGGKTG